MPRKKIYKTPLTSSTSKIIPNKATMIGGRSVIIERTIKANVDQIYPLGKAELTIQKLLDKPFREGIDARWVCHINYEIKAAYGAQGGALEGKSSSKATLSTINKILKVIQKKCDNLFSLESKLRRLAHTIDLELNPPKEEDENEN